MAKIIKTAKFASFEKKTAQQEQSKRSEAYDLFRSLLNANNPKIQQLAKEAADALHYGVANASDSKSRLAMYDEAQKLLEQISSLNGGEDQNVSRITSNLNIVLRHARNEAIRSQYSAENAMHSFKDKDGFLARTPLG